MEKWKKFETRNTKEYFVSTRGRIKLKNNATNKEIILKPTKQRSGYTAITINEGKKTTYYVHILVAEAFIPNPENKPTVNHINGVDAGDHVENLEWATYEEQDKHARETGLKTSGNTPAIVLDTNGNVISEHKTMTEALTSYDGRQVYYNKDTQIIGNVIVMKQSYYDELSEEKLSFICLECLKQMLEFTYVVDGQLVDGGKKLSEIVGSSHSNIRYRAENKWSVNIKGHEISRFRNKIGVFQDNSKEEPIYEQITIK